MLPDEVVAHNRQWEETFQLRAYIVYIDTSEGYFLGRKPTNHKG